MLTIEVHLIDIFPDFFRKETAHVMAFTDGIPQKSGGDFHQGGFDRQYRFVGEGGFRRTRTGIDQNGVVVQDFLIVFPLGEVGEVVRSHDEAEVVGGILSGEVGQGVDGIGGFGHPEFGIADAETGIIAYSQADQFEPVEIVEQILLLLEGVLGGDHEPYLLQTGIFGHVVGDGHMPDMDGVKGTEKETHFKGDFLRWQEYVDKAGHGISDFGMRI